MSASDVAVLELVWELCGSADAAGAVRAQIQKCLSFWLESVGAQNARVLRHESNKVAPLRATDTQRTVYNLLALGGVPATLQWSHQQLHLLQHKR